MSTSCRRDRLLGSRLLLEVRSCSWGSQAETQTGLAAESILVDRLLGQAGGSYHAPLPAKSGTKAMETVDFGPSTTVIWSYSRSVPLASSRATIEMLYVVLYWASVATAVAYWLTASR